MQVDEECKELKPLHCETSTDEGFNRSNPMFGVPGILTSPPIFCIEDPNSKSERVICYKSELMKENEIVKGIPYDSQSCKAENHLELQTILETQLSNCHKIPPSPSNHATKEIINLKRAIKKITEDVPYAIKTPAKPPPPLRSQKSISYVDSYNPLMTPFLMELCSDDYNMEERDYLDDSDIEQVLNEWTNELVYNFK